MGLPDRRRLGERALGRYCRICDRHRPGEAFSRKGWMTLVCKRCAKIPRAKREAIEQSDELDGYLRQRHISDRNIARLEVLRRSENPAIAVTALLVLEIAKVSPH